MNAYRSKKKQFVLENMQNLIQKKINYVKFYPNAIQIIDKKVVKTSIKILTTNFNSNIILQVKEKKNDVSG